MEKVSFMPQSLQKSMKSWLVNWGPLSVTISWGPESSDHVGPHKFSDPEIGYLAFWLPPT